jgi:hypothetical protein
VREHRLAVEHTQKPVGQSPIAVRQTGFAVGQNQFSLGQNEKPQGQNDFARRRRPARIAVFWENEGKTGVFEGFWAENGVGELIGADWQHVTRSAAHL